MAADSNVQCVAETHLVLGEGPVWVEAEARLYWVDIKGREILRLEANGEPMRWPTPFRVGAIAPREGGGFIAATDAGIAEIDLDRGTFEVVLRPEKQLPGNRFNDGKVDRQGRFWAGTMDDSEEQATGSLYRIGPGLECLKADSGYRVTNGPAFSLDGRRMFHNDSARQVTYVFDLNEAGNASNRQTFLQFGDGDGFPDGMTVDAQGCLWIAFWDGWSVRRFSPAGELLQTVSMPIARPTSCAFGGPELDRLYITSASIGLSAEQMQMQPNAGGLFMVDAGVQGIADLPFAG